jgi:cephalosporin-C deacetylase-like acetyl esterase
MPNIHPPSSCPSGKNEGVLASLPSHFFLEFPTAFIDDGSKLLDKLSRGPAMKLLFCANGTWLSFLVLFGSAAIARGQQNPVSPSDGDGVLGRKMLYSYLLGQAQKHFDMRRAEIAGLKTPEDLFKRQKRLKTKFIEALGGFPEKTPLNAVVVGKEERDGYRIERVIYESRPNHHVTATLYLPEGRPPFPGVLMPIGHSSNGKAADYVQRGCILLARNGLAVLAYDPIGQGERRQLLDSRGKPAIASSTNEHTLVGVGALLVGQSTATYRIWDGIRSLDYLVGRAEIDARRLGCTGCSGGGTLTSYLMALDDRILAAAPSCYITSLERLFATIGPQDAEQNITGQVAFGMDHADYLTMRAPRPTLICAASRDFFDIKGTWDSFREATLLYGLLGHSERINLVEFNTGHGYPKPQREAIVRWMRRWLLHKDDAPKEPSFPIAKDADLQCTRSGQVLEDLKGKSVFHLNMDRATELAKKRANASILPEKELDRSVRSLIGVGTVRPARKVSEKEEPGKHRARIIFETEPGIHVPTWYFRSNPRPAKALAVYVHGRGKTAALESIEKLLQAGNDVLALDVRGLGETAPRALSGKPGYFGADFKEAFLSFHLNRPLLGQRVFDVLAVVEEFRTRGSTAKMPLHLLGVDSGGPIVLHAAALDSRIEAVTVEDSLLSWSAVVRSPINYDQLTNVVPGALKVYDLPDLSRLVAPRPMTVRNAVDPMLKPVSQAVLAEAYVTARKAYAARKADKNLILETR